MSGGGHRLGALNELHLATVLDTQDPQARGRIQVRLHNTGMELWAAVVVNGAGSGYGVAMLPRVDEQVVVGFASPEQALVLGALWSGGDALPSAADPVDAHYCIETPAGTRIDLEDGSNPKMVLTTPAGYHLTIDDSGAGSVTIEKGGERIELTSSGISVTTSGNVSVDATQVNVSASMVQVSSSMSSFSGVVQCDTLIATSVVGTTYTPGAGNIW